MRLALTSGGMSASYASTPREVYVRSDTDISGLQAIHDSLVTQGGGNIVFEPGTYTVVAGTQINIDASYVGIRGNNARLNISALTDGQVFLTFYCSLAANNDPTVTHNLSADDLYIYGGFTVNAGGSTGPTGVRINSTVSSATMRYQFNRCKIRGCYKGISWANRAPFVKWRDSHIRKNGIGLYQETSPTDFTESNSFTDCIFDGNDVHAYLAGGGVFTMHNTSFDYHYSRVFDIRQGGKILITGGTGHIEFDYGENSGETNSPVLLTNANSAFIMRGGCLAYTGSSQNPYWSSFVETSNSSQLVDVTLDRAVKMGRLTDTTGFDAFAVSNTSSVQPIVRLNIPPQGIDPNDIPTMTQYVDVTAGYGSGGILRSGVDDPYNEMVHHIASVNSPGTVTVSSVSASENGMTLKNGQKCIKIVAAGGGGKVLISFPVMAPQRRHAWEFFSCTSTSTSVFSGSVTIKERQTGFAFTYDGTTPAMSKDTRGAVYSGTTVTISSANATWTRRSWKSCNSSVWPSYRQQISAVILVEIDVTGMTAGALYLSHFAFDLI